MANRDQPARIVDQPQPGYFRLKLCKGGWSVPAQIIFADGMWQAVIDGVAGEPDPDPITAGVDRIWNYGDFSNSQSYSYLNALREWSRLHRPDHPAADATQPISKRRMKPIVV